MRRTLMIVAVASVIVSACAARAEPHLSRADWDAVMALGADEQIEVLMRDQRRISGTVESVNTDWIVVGPVSVSIRREDIAAVWVLPREDSLFKGYVVGAIAGLAVGAIAQVKGNAGVVIPVFMAAFGSGVGAWLDQRWYGPTRRLVYRIP